MKAVIAIVTVNSVKVANKSFTALPAPTAAKRKRSNVSEVLDVLKENIALQDKRHEENAR